MLITLHDFQRDYDGDFNFLARVPLDGGIALELPLAYLPEDGYVESCAIELPEWWLEVIEHTVAAHFSGPHPYRGACLEVAMPDKPPRYVN
jgi:hypothetical protein